MKYQSGHGAERMSGANRVYCAKIRTITAQQLSQFTALG